MGIIRDIQDDLNLAAVRLVGEHRGRLLSEAKRLCGDESEAEDLVMITFDQAFRDYDSFDPKKGDFQAWLFGILHRVYGKSNRRLVNRRTQPVDEETLSGLEEADNKTVEEILRRSDSEAVRHAIDQLDEKYKSVLMMRFYEGFSYREIAGILGKPIGTVGRRIQVALQILAGKLKSEFGAAKPKLAAIAAVFLSLASFAAVTVGIVEVVRSSLGSLGSEGSLEAAADTLDPKVPNPDPIDPKDPNSPASTGADTLSTNTENNKEETMNLKSITQTAAKLSVGAVLTTGLAGNGLAGWEYDGTDLVEKGAETPWKLKVSVNGNDLTVTGVRTAGTSTEFDWTEIDAPYRLVSFGERAFFGQTTITKVVLPETVTSIGLNSFRGCTALVRVTLPQGLQTLGSCAFYGDTALESVSPLIPNSATIEGTANFYNCPKLAGKVVIANPAVTSIPDQMFQSDACITEVDLSKSGVTSIGYNAFRMCTALETVRLPATVTTIGDDPFHKSAACTVFFKSFPTAASGKAFELEGDYRLRVVVSASDADWMQFCATAGDNFIAYDDWPTKASKAVTGYTYGDEDTYTPYGVFKMGAYSRWVYLATENTVGSKLTVVTSPEGADLLAAVTPACAPGSDIDLPYTSSVAGYVKSDTRCMRPTGYTLYKSDVESGWQVVETKTGVTSATIPEGSQGVYRLQWNFEPVGYALSVADVNPDWGEVSLPDPDVEGAYYAAGSSVTVTLDDRQGYFRYWVGGVTPETERNATATVVMDGVKTLTPVFCWVYDSGAATLSNGDWTLNTTGSDDALSIKNVKTAGSFGLVDLREIANATLVEIGGAAFKSKLEIQDVRLPDAVTALGVDAFRASGLTNVVLSSRLQTIGDTAFFRCENLRTVTPLLPTTLVSLGADAFSDKDPLVGDLRLSNRNLETAGSFYGTKLTSVDFSGSSVTSTCQNCFRSASTLTNVVLDAALRTIGANTFYNATASLKGLRFLGEPPETIGAEAFGGNSAPDKWTDLQCRICLPKGRGWEAYVAASCAPLALTDDEKRTFAQRFPGEKIPKEKIKLPTSLAYQYLCYYTTDTGFKLLFR